MADMSLKQTFTHKFPEDIVKKIEEDMLLPFYVGGIAFSPDNSEIAVGYADGVVGAVPHRGNCSVCRAPP